MTQSLHDPGSLQRFSCSVVVPEGERQCRIIRNFYKVAAFFSTSKVGVPFPRGEAMKVMLVSGEIHRKSLQLVSFASLK